MTATQTEAAPQRWRPWWALLLTAITLAGGALVLWWGGLAIATDRPNQWLSGLGTVLGSFAIALAAPAIAALIVYLIRGTRVWFWLGVGWASLVTLFVVALISGDPGFR